MSMRTWDGFACFSPPKRWWKGEQYLAFSDYWPCVTSPPPPPPLSSRGAALWNPSSWGWECGTCHHWKEWIDCTSPWLCSLGALEACSRLKGSACCSSTQHPLLQNIHNLINPVLVQHGRFWLSDYEMCRLLMHPNFRRKSEPQSNFSTFQCQFA